MAKKLDVLRDNSVQELEAKLVEMKSSLSKEKAQVASGARAEKPAKIRGLRRGIARMLTIIREKQAKAMKVPAAEMKNGEKAKGVTA